MSKIRLAVLISGRGSNLAALIEACRKPYYPAEIVVVVSDKADAPGLDLARAENIPAVHVPHPSRAGFGIGVGWPLIANKIDLIVLAGFMRVLHHGFVMRWENRILNIHPSLLPAFPGLHPQRKALDARHTTSGCTVHWVVPEVDAGPVLGRAVVPVRDDDTEDTLSARILMAEHRLYPLIINQVSNELLITRGSAAKS